MTDTNTTSKRAALEEERRALAPKIKAGDEEARARFREIGAEISAMDADAEIADLAAIEEERQAQEERRLAAQAAKEEARERYEAQASTQQKHVATAERSLTALRNALDNVAQSDRDMRDLAREAGVELRVVPPSMAITTWLEHHLRPYLPGAAFDPAGRAPLADALPLPPTIREAPGAAATVAGEEQERNRAASLAERWQRDLAQTRTYLLEGGGMAALEQGRTPDGEPRAYGRIAWARQVLTEQMPDAHPRYIRKLLQTVIDEQGLGLTADTGDTQGEPPELAPGIRPGDISAAYDAQGLPEQPQREPGAELEAQEIGEPVTYEHGQDNGGYE